MFQSAQVLLLIAAVMTCPLRCTGALRDGHADVGHHASDLCGQPCEREPSGPAGDNPQPDDSADDCDCGSCVCHGAIVDGLRLAVPADTPCDVGIPSGRIETGAVAAVLLLVSRCAHPCHFPPLISAQDMCALICTRLL